MPIGATRIKWLRKSGPCRSLLFEKAGPEVAHLAKDSKKKMTAKNGSTIGKSVSGKLKGKLFEQELAKLQEELVKVQLWVQHKGFKVVVIFEGRDAAGKGGVIKRITERVSPRVFRVVALPAPTEREKTQMYIQRYVPHFPAAGEVVIFDRSWYNRAGVERVMGFCDQQQVGRFLELCPVWEKNVVESGILLIKYWFEVSQEEQTRRFQARINDGRKIWKLSPMDLESHRRWYDYSRARDEMLFATNTSYAPWHIVNADDKRRARLNCIKHLLSLIPYHEIERDRVKLPDRQKPHGYEEPKNRQYNIVPDVY
jgi:polyphosphate kinase